MSTTQVQEPTLKSTRNARASKKIQREPIEFIKNYITFQRSKLSRNELIDADVIDESANEILFLGNELKSIVDIARQRYAGLAAKPAEPVSNWQPTQPMYSQPEPVSNTMPSNVVPMPVSQVSAPAVQAPVQAPVQTPTTDLESKFNSLVDLVSKSMHNQDIIAQQLHSLSQAAKAPQPEQAVTVTGTPKKKPGPKPGFKKAVKVIAKRGKPGPKPGAKKKTR